jgi:IS4 transposase
MFSGMQAAMRVSPLTVVVRGTIERWLAPEILEEVAKQSGSHNYERKITLEALTAIMLDAVVGMQPTVHAAAIARRDQWEGSVQALYTKLGRVDPKFSMGLVEHTAQGIAPILARGRKPQLPFGPVKILDGTMPDGSEHRLGVLRQLAAAGLPAQSVVVYDLATGLCDRVAANEDAYKGEKPLAETLLRDALPGEIYVADRGFCTCRLMAQVLDRDAFFVFRELAKDMVYEQVLPEKRHGRCSTGRVLEGQVRLCCRIRDCVWPLRRIHVELDVPTEAGEHDLWLLTNLPPTYKARAIAELYRSRWKVERHFHFIKRELHGQMPSLGEPRAAIFALCVALAAGNVLTLIKQLSISKQRKAAQPALSGYYLSLEIGHSYAAVEALTTPRDWRTIAKLSPVAFWRWACKIADQIPWSRLVVHPRGPKQRPPPRASGKHRHHFSTYRLLQENENGSNAC